MRSPVEGAGSPGRRRHRLRRVSGSPGDAGRRGWREGTLRGQKGRRWGGTRLWGLPGGAGKGQGGSVNESLCFGGTGSAVRVHMRACVCTRVCVHTWVCVQPGGRWQRGAPTPRPCSMDHHPQQGSPRGSGFPAKTRSAAGRRSLGRFLSTRLMEETWAGREGGCGTGTGCGVGAGGAGQSPRLRWASLRSLQELETCSGSTEVGRNRGGCPKAHLRGALLQPRLSMCQGFSAPGLCPSARLFVDTGNPLISVG